MTTQTQQRPEQSADQFKVRHLLERISKITTQHETELADQRLEAVVLVQQRDDELAALRREVKQLREQVEKLQRPPGEVVSGETVPPE